MIRDLSLTLKAILEQDGLPPELAAAQIVFDRPTEPFAPSPTAVDLFLYDIRENVELRSNEPVVERLNGQTRIHRPPLRVACLYLVTAWPTDADGDELALQEHRLLSQVLALLSQYPTIPETFLQGALVDPELPLPLMTAQANGFQNPAEFWTALGNKLRASLTVTVTIAMPVSAPEETPMVISREVGLEQRELPDTRETMFRIGGRVTDAAGTPVTGASVTLVESGFTTTTSADGRYSLGITVSGPGPINVILRVQSSNSVQDVRVTIPAQGPRDYDVQLT